MKIIKWFEWIFDFYIAHFLYNERKLYRYDRYMKEKWGDKYTNIKG